MERSVLRTLAEIQKTRIILADIKNRKTKKDLNNNPEFQHLTSEGRGGYDSGSRRITSTLPAVNDLTQSITPKPWEGSGTNDVVTQTNVSNVSVSKDGETQTDNLGPRTIEVVKLKDFLKRTAQAIHHPAVCVQDYLNVCLDELDKMYLETGEFQTNQHKADHYFADVLSSVLYPLLSVFRTNNQNHSKIPTPELGGSKVDAPPAYPQCSCALSQSSFTVPNPIQKQQPTIAVLQPEPNKSQDIVQSNEDSIGKHSRSISHKVHSEIEVEETSFGSDDFWDMGNEIANNEELALDTLVYSVLEEAVLPDKTDETSTRNAKYGRRSHVRKSGEMRALNELNGDGLDWLKPPNDKPGQVTLETKGAEELKSDSDISNENKANKAKETIEKERTIEDNNSGKNETSVPKNTESDLPKSSPIVENKSNQEKTTQASDNAPVEVELTSIIKDDLSMYSKTKKVSRNKNLSVTWASPSKIETVNFYDVETDISDVEKIYLEDDDWEASEDEDDYAVQCAVDDLNGENSDNNTDEDGQNDEKAGCVDTKPHIGAGSVMSGYGQDGDDKNAQSNEGSDESCSVGRKPGQVSKYAASTKQNNHQYNSNPDDCDVPPDHICFVDKRSMGGKNKAEQPERNSSKRKPESPSYDKDEKPSYDNNKSKLSNISADTGVDDLDDLLDEIEGLASDMPIVDNKSNPEKTTKASDNAPVEVEFTSIIKDDLSVYSKTKKIGRNKNLNVTWASPSKIETVSFYDVETDISDVEKIYLEDDDWEASEDEDDYAVQCPVDDLNGKNSVNNTDEDGQNDGKAGCVDTKPHIGAESVMSGYSQDGDDKNAQSNEGSDESCSVGRKPCQVSKYAASIKQNNHQYNSNPDDYDLPPDHICFVDKRSMGGKNKAEQPERNSSKRKPESPSYDKDEKPSYDNNKSKLSNISADTGVDDLDDLLDEIEGLASDMPIVNNKSNPEKTTKASDNAPVEVEFTSILKDDLSVYSKTKKIDRNKNLNVTWASPSKIETVNFYDVETDISDVEKIYLEDDDWEVSEDEDDYAVQCVVDDLNGENSDNNTDEDGQNDGKAGCVDTKPHIGAESVMSGYGQDGDDKNAQSNEGSDESCSVGRKPCQVSKYAASLRQNNHKYNSNPDDYDLPPDHICFVDKRSMGGKNKAEQPERNSSKRKPESPSYDKDVKPSYDNNKSKHSNISADTGVDDLDDLLDEIEGLASDMPNKRACFTNPVPDNRAFAAKDMSDRTSPSNDFRDHTAIPDDVKSCNGQTEDKGKANQSDTISEIDILEADKLMKSSNEELSSPRDNGDQTDDESDSIIEEIFDEMSDDNEFPKPLHFNETQDSELRNAQRDKESRADDQDMCDKKHGIFKSVNNSDPQPSLTANETQQLKKAIEQKQTKSKHANDVQRHVNASKSVDYRADIINVPNPGPTSLDRSPQKKQEVSDRDQTAPDTNGFPKNTSEILLLVGNPLLRRGSTLTPLAPLDDCHKKKKLKKKKKSDKKKRKPQKRIRNLKKKNKRKRRRENIRRKSPRKLMKTRKRK